MPTAPSSVQNKTVPGENKAQNAAALKHWNLSAKIGIRNQHEAVSANLHWQQQGKNYHITLMGPLGSGTYELTGQPGKVELAVSDGKHFQATSPEDILAQQSGWQVPVSNLYYWVRGLPVPNSPAQKNFDSSNRLTQLQQQGWNIHYLSYTSVNRMDVPNKIFLEKPPLSVKIAISQWVI
jgi:outer membrane lipoprotein LolB